VKARLLFLLAMVILVLAAAAPFAKVSGTGFSDNGGW
jgi:hypothetical protein